MEATTTITASIYPLDWRYVKPGESTEQFKLSCVCSKDALIARDFYFVEYFQRRWLCADHLLNLWW